MDGRIGIICAADTELAPFLPHICGCTVTEHAMLRFYEGTIGEVPVVALYSGVCKVNAALAVQLLIDRFGVAAVINAGTAGGMEESLRIFDTVVSTEAAYHDVADDILTEFHPWMPTIYFAADLGLLAAAKRAAQAEAEQERVRFGRMVTGEAFIEDEHRAEILEKYAPLSVDMETAAIAHVCYVNQVPFLAVRTITDTAEHAGMAQFEENCDRAAEIAKDFTLRLISELKPM